MNENVSKIVNYLWCLRKTNPFFVVYEVTFTLIFICICMESLHRCRWECHHEIVLLVLRG
jgi:hypothetical protein